MARTAKVRIDTALEQLERRKVRKVCTKVADHAIVSGMAGSIKSADFFDSIWISNSFFEVASWMYETPDLANRICRHSVNAKWVKSWIEL